MTQDWLSVDVARAFSRRVLAPEATAGKATSREGDATTASRRRELLLLRIARALLVRGGGEARARLRAWGAVLTALSGPPSGVRLGLDGLGLADGTTKRSADVLRAAGRPAPYLEEVPGFQA